MKPGPHTAERFAGLHNENRLPLSHVLTVGAFKTKWGLRNLSSQDQYRKVPLRCSPIAGRLMPNKAQLTQTYYAAAPCRLI